MMARAILPSYVYLYFFAQSINLTVAVISVALVAPVGNRLASDPFLSTVPYGVQFLFLLVASYPVALFMKKWGRRTGFVAGALFLFLAGGAGYLAVVRGSFFLLILSHGLIGLFAACANFYRYAVTDDLPERLHARALSLVVAGGVIAGVCGPVLAGWFRDISGFAPFSLSYALLSVFALVNLLLVFFLPNSRGVQNPVAPALGSHRKGTMGRVVFYPIFIAAFGYGLMNLFMILASLKMEALSLSFDDAARALQWHVLAMFVPSFFTGRLITRFGHHAILFVGVVLFVASFAMNIQSVEYGSLLFSLVLLGVGWNLTYVGGSALLSSTLSGHPDQKKWQGVGETVIASFAALGAVSPAFLLNSVGWTTTQVMALVACAFPLLVLTYVTRKKAA